MSFPPNTSEMVMKNALHEWKADLEILPCWSYKMKGKNEVSEKH